MTWKFTIVCDGCGRWVVAGLTKRRALRDLYQVGGRQAGDARHLCPDCRG